MPDLSYLTMALRAPCLANNNNICDFCTWYLHNLCVTCPTNGRCGCSQCALISTKFAASLALQRCSSCCQDWDLQTENGTEQSCAERWNWNHSFAVYLKTDLVPFSGSRLQAALGSNSNENFLEGNLKWHNIIYDIFQTLYYNKHYCNHRRVLKFWCFHQQKGI